MRTYEHIDPPPPVLAQYERAGTILLLVLLLQHIQHLNLDALELVNESVPLHERLDVAS